MVLLAVFLAFGPALGNRTAQAATPQTSAGMDVTATSSGSGAVLASANATASGDVDGATSAGENNTQTRSADEKDVLANSGAQGLADSSFSPAGASDAAGDSDAQTGASSGSTGSEATSGGTESANTSGGTGSASTSSTTGAAAASGAAATTGDVTVPAAGAALYAATPAVPTLSGRAHIQSLGWRSASRSSAGGVLLGTTGRGLRLEALALSVSGASSANASSAGTASGTTSAPAVSIEYRASVPGQGWQDWRTAGQTAGTEGRSQYLDAVCLRLTGADAGSYQLWYRVHMQSRGWMDWAKGGDPAGMAGYGKRLEALEVVLLPVGQAAPGSTATAYLSQAGVQAQAHCQSYGWMAHVVNGTAGTSGKSKRLEAVRLSLVGLDVPGSIVYQVHCQGKGWMSPVRDGALAGTCGQSRRIEAVKVHLEGEAANLYSVQYRVHCQSLGTLGWTADGGQAGTTGRSLRLEFIQIRLVKKGTALPTGTVSATGEALGTPFGAHGRLRVSGSRLVDAKGQAYQLRGVSTHGLAWFPDYVNEAAFKTLRTDWKANCVRLALYTDEYNGYCNGGNRTWLEGLIDKGVKAATAQGQYVIIDWHMLNDANPAGRAGEAADFFGRMSKKYAGYDNVIYEIWNEPNVRPSKVTWSQIKAYANQVIPAIRRNAPNALVIVGTPNWSQEVDQAAASPLSYGNVLYTLHFYANTHRFTNGDTWVRQRAEAALAKGLPIFVSEFGTTDASGSGSNDFAQAAAWLDYLDKNRISYVAWSLCNKGETSALVSSGCSKTSGWSAGELSASGQWVRQQYRSRTGSGV